jgi:WD40 repeat protein
MSKYLITAVIVACTHPLAFAQQRMTPAATYHGHVDSVRAVAFSPDGKLLASGSDDQSIILWDLAQGKPRAVLEGHRTSIWNLAFSPDGKTLASGIGQPSSDRPSGWDFNIKLWDVETGRLRRSLVGANSNVFSMAYSPDGRYLAACHNASNDNVKIWDVATGRLLGSPTRGGHGQALAFSNDGKLLAVANGGTDVELWEPATGERKGVVRVNSDVTGGLRFSPDDRLLAVGTAKSVTLCELANGKELRKFEEVTLFPQHIVFTPDGKSLLAADWHLVRMWDVQTGKVQAEFRGAPSENLGAGVNCVAVSRDGTMLPRPAMIPW